MLHKDPVAQEVLDVVAGLSTALAARPDIDGIPDYVLANTVRLAREAVMQRLQSMRRVVAAGRLSNHDPSALEQQHKQFVVGLLFGSVMQPTFQLDAPATFDVIVRNTIRRAETLLNASAELIPMK